METEGLRGVFVGESATGGSEVSEGQARQAPCHSLFPLPAGQVGEFPATSSEPCLLSACVTTLPGLSL